MLRRFRVLTMGVLFAALLPTTAGAQSAVAPPGNSAVDQYHESVPEPDGARRSLSQRERTALRELGADGEALAETIDRQGGVSAAALSAAVDATERQRGSRDRPADRDDTGQNENPAAVEGRDGKATPPDDRGAVAVSTSAVGDQLPFGWMAAIAALLATVGIVRWRRA